jgi:AraC-like DNA-binding protein
LPLEQNLLLCLDVNAGPGNRDGMVMDEGATNRIYFNTDVLPGRDRFPAFCEGMFRHVIGADIVQLGSGPFSGQLDIRRAGAVGIAHISVTPARMTRHASNLSDGNDAIVVQSWKRGSGGLTQGELENRIEPHDALIIDNAKPARVCAESASDFWSLTIPRDSIVASAPGVTRFAGTKSTGSSGFRLLFKYLEEIAAEDFADWRTAQLVGDHLIDLTAFALGAVANNSASDDGVAVARRTTILREIERHSSDPGLSAITIAPLLGITPRYVHLLLEETGKSFTHHVLERRLEKAAALLRDPQWSNSKIADIAAEAGFNDLSYFNRAFRRHFGATPSDLRAAASSS